jgi:hypothetical protein
MSLTLCILCMYSKKKYKNTFMIIGFINNLKTLINIILSIILYPSEFEVNENSNT